MGKMKVHLAGKVDGDTVSGSLKTIMGKLSFEGGRT